MNKESFENNATVEIMNKYFVNIKADLEERLDMDKMYMVIGGGGWPIFVFMTPHHEPLTGGTFFPSEDMIGRRGFKTAVNCSSNVGKKNYHGDSW